MKNIVNLRVEKDIKDNFKDVCRLSNSCMSYEIIRFMKDYIREGGSRLKKDLNNLNEVENMRNMIKEKISDNNMNDSRLKDFSF
jgi:uncharacterized protein YaaR (DUF327 family)